MRLTPKNLLIVLAFGLMCYALIDGIRYGSGWGTTMALCSMAALYISIRLSRRLSRLNEEAEQD